MKSIPLTALLLPAAVSASTVWAQQVDAYLGLGTARASSTGQRINTFGDGTLYDAPAMGGVFTDFGVSLFINEQVGVGWTASWRSAHDYAGLQYRPNSARAPDSRAYTSILPTGNPAIKYPGVRPHITSWRIWALRRASM